MSQKSIPTTGEAKPRSYTLRLTPAQRTAMCLRCLMIAREMQAADGGTKADREDLRATLALLLEDLEAEPLNGNSPLLPYFARTSSVRASDNLMALDGAKGAL